MGSKEMISFGGKSVKNIDAIRYGDVHLKATILRPYLFADNVDFSTVVKAIISSPTVSQDVSKICR